MSLCHTPHVSTNQTQAELDDDPQNAPREGARRTTDKPQPAHPIANIKPWPGQMVERTSNEPGWRGVKSKLPLPAAKELLI
jgi:hypothetical protein